MPKVNVYLPDELAAEAKAAGLPLSPICQLAIRKELDELAIAQSVTADLETVAARLNATIDAEDVEQRHDGREDGIAWAREYATASELRWIVDAFEPGTGGDFERESFDSMLDFVSAKEGTWALSWRHEDNAYWRGFVAGAEEVLEAVRPLLNG